MYRDNKLTMANLAMMGALSLFSGIVPRRRPEPYYFDYSGIPTEEQLRKREERKARKRAKKGKVG